MNPNDKNDKTPLEQCEEHFQLTAGQPDPGFDALIQKDPEVRFWYDQLPQIIKAVEKVTEDQIREEIRAAHAFWQTGADDPDEAWEDDVMKALHLNESNKIRTEIHNINPSTTQKEPVIRNLYYQRIIQIAAIVLLAVLSFWGYQNWNSAQHLKQGLLAYGQFIQDDIDQLELQGIGIENPDAREQLSEVLRNFGSNPALDLEKLDAVLNTTPDLEEAYLYKAITLARLKHYEEALATLENINETSFGCELPYYKALIRRMNGDKRALSEIRELPQRYPDCQLTEEINQLLKEL